MEKKEETDSSADSSVTGQGKSVKIKEERFRFRLYKRKNIYTFYEKGGEALKQFV